MHVSNAAQQPSVTWRHCLSVRFIMLLVLMSGSSASGQWRVMKHESRLCVACSGTAGPVQLPKLNHTSPSSSQLSRRPPGKHTSSVLREMNEPGCGSQSDQGLAALSIGINGGSVTPNQQLQRFSGSRLTSNDQAGSNKQIVAKKEVPKPGSAGKLLAGLQPTPTSQQYSLQDLVGVGYDQGNERLAARQAKGHEYSATGQAKRQMEGRVPKGVQGQAEQRQLLGSRKSERQNNLFLGKAQQQNSCAALCIACQPSQYEEQSSNVSLQPISVQGLTNSLAGPGQQKPCRRKPAKQASDASKGKAGRARAIHQQTDATAPGAKDLHLAACLQAEGNGCH